MRTEFKAILAAGTAIAMIPSAASANIIEYDVTDHNPGASCSHGLWTNNAISSDSCTKKFSFQDGTKFTVDTSAGTGTFTGTAINDLGQTAVLDLSFSGFQDELDLTQNSYKAGGLPYDPATMDFFTMGSGTITIDGQTYSLNGSDPFAGNTVFQFGTGANDKNSAFGGSAWLNMLDPHNNPLRHWDINFNLKQIPVPAPAGALLFGLGLLGLWAGRRRKAAVAA